MLKKVLIIMLMFLIISIRILYINISNKELYSKLLDRKINNYVYGSNAPRGRIIDRNGKILVDNIGIKTVFYSKIKGITIKEELEIAEKLANILSIKVNDNTLKKYWLIKNNNGNDLITEEERKLYKLRKINDEELNRLKFERVAEDKLNKLTELDKEIATIYDLMNRGYYYDKKEIIKSISDEEYSLLIDENIKGVTTELTWERIYNYGDTLKDIFGTIGKISEENKNEYLKKGYALNDIVGNSYLELYYEDYLKGEKDLYKVNNDNSLTLVKEGKKGNDLILSIDIDVQLKLENILKENMLNAKKRKHTEYFSESYAIVGIPNTGEIVAMSGQKLEDNKFKNINSNIINSSFTVGSVVKMGTISTGYKNNIIDIGSSVKDGCIKLYQVPLKCSYKNLGKINDLTAISRSSNYYQFKIALGLTGKEYKYNMKLDTSSSEFKKFRDMYSEYGLGTITGIDLPNEKTGIIGKNMKSDLLLNLSIGQYDTYTPIELFQYVNTIASLGNKRKPSLMKEIDYNNNTILKNDYDVINKVSLEDKYKERLREAMHLAITSGTARGYIDSKYNGAGKTGTSETFIDTNNDGKVDRETTSIAFVGFAPYNNPEYSIVVLAPHIYAKEKYDYGKVYITRYISKSIFNFLFEN